MNADRQGGSRILKTAIIYNYKHYSDLPLKIGFKDLSKFSMKLSTCSLLPLSSTLQYISRTLYINSLTVSLWLSVLLCSSVCGTSITPFINFKSEHTPRSITWSKSHGKIFLRSQTISLIDINNSTGNRVAKISNNLNNNRGTVFDQ